VKAAGTRASFFEDPTGRYLRGRTWIFACPREGLYATFLAGTPDEADLRELTGAYAVPAARAPHVVLFDGSRLEAIDHAAHSMLLEVFAARTERLTRVMTRLAVVHGEGTVGAVIAGYPKMLPLLCAPRLFRETDAALEWLDVPAALRREVVELADTLGPQDADLVRLSGLLGERPSLSLEDAARALRLAPRTLQQRLRDAGSSFQRTVSAARRSAAERRMLETDEPLTTIALAVGFASLQSFTDWFRAQTGEAPSAWRRQRRPSES
jgi:AraC-like DNA-binding protein